MKSWVKKFQLSLNKKKFSKVAANIRHSPPVKIKKNDNIIIVSQVYHAAMDMSLLALKSFAHHFTQGRFEIIDDGSLTSEDHKVLKHHLPNTTITHIDEVPLGKCPKGGTWERLIRIIELSKEGYVIQVDTDTLTLGAVPEIVHFVENNQAFTIGNPMWPRPASIEYMSNMAAVWQGEHVQVQTERNLVNLNSTKLKQYCRGCSAFAGFPKGTLEFKMLEDFSVEMEKTIGKQKWYEWGSEQVSSNVMISLCENAKILPWPKYINFGFPVQAGGNRDLNNFIGKTSFVHFIGSHRFSYRTYEKLSANVISMLKN